MNILTKKCKKCDQLFEQKRYFKNICQSCRAITSQINGKTTQKIPCHISNNMFQVMLGTILGDGCFENNGKKLLYANYLIGIKHGLKQTGYVLWKKELLGNLCPSKVQYPKNRIRIRTVTHPEITKLAKQLIDCGRKSLKYETFQKLDRLGFAVWYMDDGNLSFNHGITPVIRFATCAFTLEEINKLRKIFQENNFDTGLCQWKNPRNPSIPYYGIRLNKTASINFINWILEEIIPPKCMEYKFQLNPK